MKENESREREYVVKSYIQNSLNVDIKESENDRIYTISPEIKKNGKTF